MKKLDVFNLILGAFLCLVGLYMASRGFYPEATFDMLIGLYAFETGKRGLEK